MQRILLLLAVLALAGCHTQSISNAGYDEDYYYRGELSELQVLGVVPDEQITEEDIGKALDARPKIALERGDAIVFVQSGAQFPDEALMEKARKSFNPIPLSGVPTQPYDNRGRLPHEDGRNTPELNQSLRLAAARAGADVLVVYWGIIEVGREGYATRAVSWVPVVGWVLPDEDQTMRIRIKAAVIDVRTGAWEFLIPEAYSDKTVTSFSTRRDKHNAMVEQLKADAYADLVKMMETRYLDR